MTDKIPPISPGKSEETSPKQEQKKVFKRVKHPAEEPPSDQLDRLSKLPKGPLQEIFKYLNFQEGMKLRSVSKDMMKNVHALENIFIGHRNFKVYDVNQLLKDLSQKDHPHYFDLIGRLSDIHYLDLSDTYIDTQQLKELLVFFPNLKSINLMGNCELDPGHIQMIVSKYPKLETLYLGYGYQYKDEISTYFPIETYDELLNLKNLKQLNINSSNNVNDNFIQKLCCKFQDLEEVSLYYCPHIKGHNWFLENIFLKNIKILKINKGHLTDESVHQIFSHCPNLEVLYMDANYELTGKDWILDSSQPLNLKELSLMYNKLITDDALYMILKKTPKLKDLYLVGCTSLTGKDWVSELSFLKDLTFLSIGETYLEADTIFNISKNLPQLVELSVSNCSNVTDNLMVGIINNYPKLESLYIYNCPSLTGEGWIEKLVNLTHLTKLDIGYNKFGPKVLIEILKNTPHLTNVDLSYYEELTDDVIKELVKSCPNITTLSLAYSGGLSENGFLQLKELKALSYLNLANYKGQSFNELKEFVTGNESLKTLEFYEENLTPEEINELEELCPGLDIIFSEEMD